MRLIGTVTIDGAGVDDNAKRLDERSKGVTFKNCAPFIDCIKEINNTQIDHAKLLPTDNLIEYSNNYSKTLGNFRQYYRDVLNDILTNSKSIKFKMKITEKKLLLVKITLKIVKVIFGELLKCL